jgi:hypothetical protein
MELNTHRANNPHLLTAEVTCPSGATALIRESNADDEGILSTRTYLKQMTHVDFYTMSMILQYTTADGVPIDTTKLSSFHSIPSADRYYLLLCERILSYGPIVEFPHTFNSGDHSTFTIDLREYLLRDTEFFQVSLSNPFYPAKEEEIPISPYAAKTFEPIPLDGMEFDVMTHKGARSFRMTRQNQTKLLASSSAESSAYHNDLQSRNLAVKYPDRDTYIPVTDFSTLSGLESSYVKGAIEDRDPAFELRFTVINPKDSTLEMGSFVGIPDFFAPVLKPKTFSKQK